MKILGIDPGTATTGFGVIESDGSNYRLCDAGVIKTPARQAQDLRLLTIYDNLLEVINETKPDEVAVEQLFFAQNVTTAMSVSQARGVILLVLAKSGLLHYEYSPLKVKLTLTGYGRAEKSQIQQMVMTILGLSEVPKPDDCADALAIAICHGMTHRP